MSRELEAIATIHEKDLDELINNLTEKSPEDLHDSIISHFETLIGDDYSNYDSRYARGEKSSLNTSTYKQREVTLIGHENALYEWYKRNEREYLNTETFADFINHLNNEGYAGSTIETRYWQLVSFVTEELSDTIEEECKDVSHHSLIDDKDENDKSRKGEGARPITEREKEVMLQAARDKNNKKLVVILRILYQTGLRAKELAELELEDIDLEEMEIEVETAKRDGHTRTLSINPSLREDLQTYINKHRMKFTQAPSSEYLLPTHKSKNMYPRNLTREVRNLAKDVGIQNENPDEQFIAQNGATRNEITVHSFRKRFGLNRLNDPDGNVRKAQLLLGHKDMTTTQHYLELDDEDLDYEP